jgi:chromosomal replication initiator protein
LEDKVISLDLAKEVLKDLLKEPKKLVTIDFIQRCVVEEFGITIQDLRQKKRNKAIVLPRQVAMYLSREMTDLSLPEIGAAFGGKDHTTVLHRIKDKRKLGKTSGTQRKDFPYYPSHSTMIGTGFQQEFPL